MDNTINCTFNTMILADYFYQGWASFIDVYNGNESLISKPKLKKFWK
jgi:hypothetical protein